MKTAEIHTSKGVMKVEFYEQDAPNTVKNFTDLAAKGYYDGLKFHRVIPNFVIQGGCPNTRAGAKGQPGTGGPGYKIDCETKGGQQYHERGALSMAHAGKKHRRLPVLRGALARQHRPPRRRAHRVRQSSGGTWM